MATPLHNRVNSSVLFQSKSISVNSLLLVLLLCFVTFNTWVTLSYVLHQQDTTQIWQEAASHAPPLASMASPYGLVIPHGPATALPSIRTSSDEEESINRKSFTGGRETRPI
ncbi:hypothetical protein ACHAXR_003931 [Thalassiosira sp. AJA248-18]